MSTRRRTRKPRPRNGDGPGEPPEKSVRFNIYLPRELADAVDSEVADRRKKRRSRGYADFSSVFRDAIAHYLKVDR